MKFEIGELAIVVKVNNKRSKSCGGVECEIVSALHMLNIGERYSIIIPGDPNSNTSDGHWEIAAKYLRKKRPPLTTWDKVEEYTNWNPRVPVEVDR